MDGKYRTREGKKARIICVDRQSKEGYPVIALVVDDAGVEQPTTYTKYGKWAQTLSTQIGKDLVEISPYEDFKIDDKIMVKNEGGFWIRRHFAGIDREGRPMAFNSYGTSWINTGTNAWEECRRPTEKELTS